MKFASVKSWLGLDALGNSGPTAGKVHVIYRHKTGKLCNQISLKPVEKEATIIRSSGILNIDPLVVFLLCHQ